MTIQVSLNDNFDLYSRDDELKTPLILARLSANEAMVKALLRHKSTDVNVRDQLGRTALKYSVLYRRSLLAGLLLDHSFIDVELRDCDDNSCDEVVLSPSSGEMTHF